jgi:hypothetical protein
VFVFAPGWDFHVKLACQQSEASQSARLGSQPIDSVEMEQTGRQVVIHFGDDEQALS